MSFSCSAIGRPTQVKQELQRQCDAYGEGQSKEEFKAALEPIFAVIDQNVGSQAVVEVSANGSASFVDGKKHTGQLTVNVKAGWL